MEWAWWYFGGTRDDVILDRTEELPINWSDESEDKAG
jgi:hypothetical protein